MKPLIAAAFLAISTTTPTFAYCSRPEAPYCAGERGPFSDQSAALRCQSEVRSFGREVEEFAQCIGDARDPDVRAAIRDYEEAASSLGYR